MKTLLIVDDEPVQLTLLQEIAEKKLGYRAVAVSSGQEAIDYIMWKAEPAPDIVLLDLFMPEIDGMAVLRAVSSVRPDLPIIVLTQYGNNQRAMEAITNG